MSPVRRSIIKLLLLYFLFLPHLSNAQYFDSGQDPSKIKWDQINTEYFQIIFPKEYIKDAQRLANALEISYVYNTQTLKFKPKKISVILHNFTSMSNAFVGWAPRRIEFITMPPQEIYPQDWIEQLAIHEYRHVVQLSKMNQGFTKILHFLFGEQISAGVLGLYIPLWFVEGDAVASETALSNSGRGRLPEFEMQLRTQVMQQKIHPYEKAVLGSYKDFIPDRYVLGYQLTANGRKKYGADLWDKTLDHVAKHPIALFPFSKGIKKTTHLSKWKYYNSNLQELDSLWRIQDGEIHYSNQPSINQRQKKVYTSYRYPQILNDSQVITLKSGLADIQQFVLLDNKGKEEQVFTPGYFDPVWLSAEKNLVVWPEYIFDKRWENRIYSDIIKYDIKTKKRTRLTKKRYLFSPSLSPDASKIAAIEVSPENQFSLVILDATNGKELTRISHPENEFLITPTWSENGEQIVLILLGKKGKSIAMVNLEKASFTTVLPYSFKDITQPRNHGNFIFFHGTYSGIDNIYSLDLPTGKVYQVSFSRFGAFDPEISANGSKLLYSDYSALGFNIQSQDLNPDHWINLDSIGDNSIKLYQSISSQENGIINFDSMDSKVYPVKRYRKFPHLLNIHSWSPLDVDLNNYSLNPGITLLSQNKLSTAIIKASYVYNYNEKAGEVITSISYKALYPVIELSTSNGRRTSGTFSDREDSSYYHWNEQNYGLSLSQNLNLTRGKYSRFLNLKVKSTYRNISNTFDVPINFRTGSILDAEFGGTFTRLIKAAQRDMRPKWGESILLNYKTALHGNFLYKNLFSSQASFYLPGMVKHHSLMLTGVYQNQGEGTYSFTSPVNYARGYKRIGGFRDFTRISIDYKFPVAYPDLRLGPIVYLKRIKANLFYDYGYAKNKFRSNTFQSVGAEITNDVHLFNFLAPLNLGFRYLYRPTNNTSAIELIFGINFNNI
jgi:hypothetical protein